VPRGLLKLTWLEIKIFAREPLGLVGTVFVPVLIFVVLGRLIGGSDGRVPSDVLEIVAVDLPVLGALIIIITVLLSLMTIIALYRESGILKRLRATPLRPSTILTAHVLVKLFFTSITLLLLVLAGKRYYPLDLQVPLAAFALALVISTVSLLSIGFLLASLIPTARFAQPIGAILFYPMLGICGLFTPVSALPPGLRDLARLLPFTYATSLMKGTLMGDRFAAHVGDLAALALIFIVCTTLASRVFRWE
jgi:ABC-2 type transport system permease protein